jgi:hypothetical protein
MHRASNNIRSHTILTVVYQQYNLSRAYGAYSRISLTVIPIYSLFISGRYNIPLGLGFRFYFWGYHLQPGLYIFRSLFISFIRISSIGLRFGNWGIGIGILYTFFFYANGCVYLWASYFGGFPCLMRVRAHDCVV